MIFSILFAVFSIFPVSFFFYTLSERLIATHELRVGKQIKFPSFLVQTWVDAKLECKKLLSNWMWAVYLLQFSILFCFDFDVEYLTFIYFALNAFVGVVLVTKYRDGVVERIEADRMQIRTAVGLSIATFCVFGCFTPSQTTSLAQIHFSVLELLFVIPFQLAGMILFGEYPFGGMSKKTGWLQSARFYGWSMLATKLFLGGGSFFIDFHIKAAILYVLCRLFGVYFPKFHHRDLLRISILYLFPLTGILWLFAMLTYGFIGGSSRV